MFGFFKFRRENKVEVRSNQVGVSSSASHSHSRNNAKNTAPKDVARTVNQSDVGSGNGLVELKEFLFGGLQTREHILDSRKAVVERDGLVFYEVINSKLNLSASYSSSLAVALITSASKQVVFFVDSNSVSENEVKAVVEIVKRQGYSLPSGIQAHLATSNVILPLVKGAWTTDAVKADRELRKDVKKNALFTTFTDIIAWAYTNSANDVDFILRVKDTESHIAMKISGKYKRIPKFSIPTDSMRQILGLVWQRGDGGASSSFSEISDTQCKISLELPTGSRDIPNALVSLRWSGAPCESGAVVTMRIQPIGDSVSVKSLEDAGYTATEVEVFDRVIHSHGGMVILAGEVGSGKSTSLAAVINRLPSDMKKISIEDPVELLLPDVYQRTITRDLNSVGSSAFIAASRSVFRSALDILLLGEVRDEDTGLLARALSESGHAVFTTIHARDGLGIIDRMASPAIGIPRDVLSAPGIVKLLVFQALLPTVCPNCGLDHDSHMSSLSGKELLSANRQLEIVGLLYKIPNDSLRFRNPNGCKFCRKDEIPELNGYAGRTVVAEMIELDEKMLEFIEQSKPVELRRYWRSKGSKDFRVDQCDGRTVVESAIYRASLGKIDLRDIETQFSSFESIFRKEGSLYYGL